VTQMTAGSGSPLDYGFDASSNLTTLPTGASSSYDDASELTSSTLAGTAASYSYDSDGQRTVVSQGGSTIASASYNGAQELTSYNDSAANMSAATYDGDGMRISSTVTPAGGSATTQTYLWDTSAAMPHLVMDSTNAYIYGPANAPVEQVSLTSGGITYLVPDRLGSVRGAVNESGSLTNSTSYDAWGNPKTSGGLTSSTPFGYAGDYTDPTGLNYNLHRYYDPGTGQFISVDPLIDQTGAPYSYAGQDPINGFDLDGNCFICSDPLGVVSSAKHLYKSGTHHFAIAVRRVSKVHWDFVLLAGADAIESAGAFATGGLIISGCAAADVFTFGAALVAAPFCITSAAAAATGGYLLAKATAADLDRAFARKPRRRRR
jgi:RHS repeat-associated protein